MAFLWQMTSVAECIFAVSWISRQLFFFVLSQLVIQTQCLLNASTATHMSKFIETICWILFQTVQAMMRIEHSAGAHRCVSFALQMQSPAEYWAKKCGRQQDSKMLSVARAPHTVCRTTENA